MLYVCVELNSAKYPSTRTLLNLNSIDSGGSAKGIQIAGKPFYLK